MSKVCCRFYPACYCLELPSDPAHEQRMRLLRDGSPGANPLDIYFERQSRRRAQRQRNAIVCAAAFVVAALVLALTLAGCGPDDGVIKSPAPEPTGTEMFTVIRPPVGHLVGGIYDNN